MMSQTNCIKPSGVNPGGGNPGGGDPEFILRRLLEDV